MANEKETEEIYDTKSSLTFSFCTTTTIQAFYEFCQDFDLMGGTIVQSLGFVADSKVYI